MDDVHAIRASCRYSRVGDASGRNHIAYQGPVLIDARMKPWYPKEVTCRPEVAATVTRRWREYFPHRDVRMGDAEKGHLD